MNYLTIYLHGLVTLIQLIFGSTGKIPIPIPVVEPVPIDRKKGGRRLRSK